MVNLPGRQLGQLRPTDTNAASVYTPDNKVRVQVTKIVVANTTGSACTFRIFHDKNGTTYDETTALFYDTDLKANETFFIEEEIWMDGREQGNLAVRSSSGNAINFTVYGIEERNS